MHGKFLFADGQKLYVRGATYGTFAPGGTWDGYPEPEVVASDFAAMAAAGINTVRVYTAPDRGLLDLAHASGLYVLTGLAWEQHVAFLDDRGRASDIEARVRNDVRSIAGHPAVLAYSVGNEIPAPIVRWHGPRPVERFLARLADAVRDEDADALVTYVNYPSTEYLQLPFLDLVSFNVFLEEEERLDAYVARLQNIAGDRPLLLTELGLDSRGNGDAAQAAALEWQIRTAFRGGCAGAVAFAWTDEWHRGGHEIEDWDFGIVDRERRPKPALAAVRDAFADVPLPAAAEWPLVSVVVCSHNGAATLAETLEGIAALAYPNFETIVVDDGSTDETAAIADRFDVRLVRTDNRGLSAARNRGLLEARGAIVAYTDDDATPDAHWLHYVVAGLLTSHHSAIGGPNIPPADAGLVADAVARAPGGPVHVLLSDQEAEHIPGCNMAFWADRLRDVGGFDPQFRVAGDDVDMCWQIHERGWTIGFHPGAVVWHRRRPSVRAFWRQQRGYGRAEALLERKWPEKYNGTGHLTWSGRVYSGPTRQTGRRWHIYYGTWGTGLFQSVYERSSGAWRTLPLMPEWYVVIALLGLLAGYDLVEQPLIASIPGTGLPLTLPLFLLAVFALVAKALRAGWKTGGDLRVRALTAALTGLQPLARLVGRVGAGLTPWRVRRGRRLGVPWPRTKTVWSERWGDTSTRLARVEARVRGSGSAVRRGSDFDRWDIQVRSGLLGSARLRLAIEEHGSGKQLLRFRVWPRLSPVAAVFAGVLALRSFELALNSSSALAFAVAGAATLLLVRGLAECSAAVGLCLEAVDGEAELREPDELRGALPRPRTEIPEARVRRAQRAEAGERVG